MGPQGRSGKGQRSCDPRWWQLWRPSGGPEAGLGRGSGVSAFQA